ncbi:uncharacterized protein LOC125505095 [Dendroctonus ponderosae]|uniref:uncharacterized protein LOC125505095 n=1 Tax=Dendroctonus ponderosae TaxID=77166 RepID=UPI0020355F32|nr:uncharacterized protein LOC125505095 [Dendroctonus ponderosae]KAH1030041.1 hypothetical protein HUJ05_003179 [Dendroctonus ponderosae]
MGILEEHISSEEQQIVKLLISIICLYGSDGLPMENVESEFIACCGFPIPWKQFGAYSLRSWLITLPYIYIIENHLQEEVLMEYSPKSVHIKDLIVKQKRNSSNKTNCNGNKRKADKGNDDYQQPYKMKKRLECENLPEGSFIHTCVKYEPQGEPSKNEKFEQLETMLPLFYRHQALGDDFFVDIADTKLGYYVPEKGPKRTGLCAVGQTISQLTDNVSRAQHLAPRVVVMIGFQDLIDGSSISSMITDLRQLVIELKKKNTRITLMTLIPSPKMPNVPRFQTRLEIFNRAVLDYASDSLLPCNVIDMSTIFLKETEKFKRDFDRFKKVAKNDPYKVFSDYGRKIFLNALKSCLKEQLEYGF